VAAIGLGMTLIITFIAWAWFGVPFRGSLLFLLACSMLYLLSIMGIGLYISVVSRTQLEAQLTANLLISPLIILSGFLFPISNMPLVAQWLSYLVPTRYFIQVVRGVFLKGQGAAELWQPAAALAVLGVLLYLIGTLSYRKQAD
jgi:ABC-2 type transport system permease protein